MSICPACERKGRAKCLPPVPSGKCECDLGFTCDEHGERLSCELHEMRYLYGGESRNPWTNEGQRALMDEAKKLKR